MRSRRSKFSLGWEVIEKDVTYVNKDLRHVVIGKCTHPSLEWQLILRDVIVNRIHATSCKEQETRLRWDII